MNYIIITPIWKKRLSNEEFKLLKITTHFNSNVNRKFLASESLNVSYYQENFPTWGYVKIPKTHLSSIQNYNKYMLSPDLYRRLMEFKFTVICQTDAVLVKNINYLNMGILDYIGSPWITPFRINLPKVFGMRITGKLFELVGLCNKVEVGNGGLSIRRNSKFYSITNKFLFQSFVQVHEDIFYAYMGTKGRLKCASPKLAQKIFQETTLTNKRLLPDVYGFHALAKWNKKLLEDVFKKTQHLFN